jgi:hypothetical protein
MSVSRHSGSLRLPRRTLAKGLVGLGAMAAGAPLWTLLASRALAEDPPTPKRLVIWYVPEGTEEAFFWPKQPGALSINMASALKGTEAPNVDEHESWILQPLQPFESRLTLVRGVFNDWKLGGLDYHFHQGRSVLSGSGPDSIEEVVGAALKGSAPFNAVRLGVLGWTQANLHSRQVFARGGNRMEVNWSPADVYNQVFPGAVESGGESSGSDALARRLGSRLALLGSVGAELRAVECAGGKEARVRLESYLGSIERVETETKALLAEQATAKPPTGEPRTGPVELVEHAFERAFWRNTTTFPETGRLMMDVAVATLALDRARSVALQWSATEYEGHDAYDFHRTETKNAGDHPISHGQANETSPDERGSPVAKRDRARTFRWYSEQLAYFLGRLASIPDGEGTLLDNTVVATMTDAGGMNHNVKDLPLMVFGAGSQGQLVEVTERPHTDYLRTLARTVGVDAGGAFGDTTGTLDALL